MYAARDKDGTLVLYKSKPYTCTKDGSWISNGEETILPNDLMIELTFEIGPVEVDFVIKNQENI